MELKYALEESFYHNPYCFNRTFMELKSKSSN